MKMNVFKLMAIALPLFASCYGSLILNSPVETATRAHQGTPYNFQFRKRIFPNIHI
jgi:hypothetical protein